MLRRLVVSIAGSAGGKSLAAFVLAAGGLVASSVGWAVATATGAEWAPIIGASGNGLAVAAVVYMFQRFMKGDLVSRSSATVEATLFDLVETSHQHVELLYDAFKKAGYPTVRPQPPRRGRPS